MSGYERQILETERRYDQLMADNSASCPGLNPQIQYPQLS